MSHGSRLALLAALAVAGCGDNVRPVEPPDAAVEPPDATIEARCDEATLPDLLRAIPSVSAVTETDCGGFVTGPARCFAIRFDQPIDHANGGTSTLSQRLFLTHRGCASPTLVADWGYENDQFWDDELSILYETNNLWIEHRYQGGSLPAMADWDWTALTIENGANDMHRVIAALQRIYGDRWVSTGASKGGITATYHNYFFPDDLDGSVPYVAPASLARIDLAYQARLDTVLTSTCAQDLRAAQVAALTSRRAMMLARLTAVFGPGFEDTMLEYMTASLDWGFWQYYGVTYCSQVPAATATDDEFWQFFYDLAAGGLAGPGPGQDPSYGALIYEWLTEQGFALQIGAHVAPLLVDPFATETMEDRFRAEFPAVALPAYNGAVTTATRTWVRDAAESVVLIYGDFDPWSGGAMEAPLRPTSGRFFVPQATHGARIVDLDPAAVAAALALATPMFGREPVLAQKPAARRAAAIRTQILDARIRAHARTTLRRLAHRLTMR